MDNNMYRYDENIKSIDRIEFSVWGNNEIKRSSALGKDSIGIDIPDLYDNTEPKKGGLIDTRLGIIDKSLDCSTCGLNSTYCVGHFGHTDLVEPVFHMGYIDYIKRILDCICLKCSKLLIYKNEDEMLDILKNKHGVRRFNEIRNIAKNVTYCQKLNYGCGTAVSKIKKEVKKSTSVVNIVSETLLVGLQTAEGTFEGKKKIRQILTPEMCFNILSNISDTDCRILGIDPSKTRPEDMIYKIFPIPPVPIRPSVKADFMSSSTMEDDLTHKLADIIKANIRTRKNKESTNEDSSKYAQDHQNLLQYHVATYYDNDTLSLPKAESQRGKVTKSLTARIPGKPGRIRGNLMGKRVDFSARTVITPDPGLEVNELGIPLMTAMNQTFPEVVTPHNIDRLQLLVRNGRNKYPGANTVFPASNLTGNSSGDYDSKPIDLRFKQERVKLRVGDIVERHLVDGDYVLLNRQPTLHKLSMMAHKIKVIMNDDLRTFRLNLSVTQSYNADFDGDEMNIFVPQSLQTLIELQEIANVKKQVISPRLSSPIIGIVQDGLLGAYNMTDTDMRIDWKSAMDMMSYSSLTQDLSVIKKNKQYNGTELFSMIIPNKINSGPGGKVNIVNGKIIGKGQLTKKQLGASKNGLIHLVWDQYGEDVTSTFINDTQKIVNSFNLYNGFTVGIGDINVPESIEQELNKLFETKKLHIDHLITEMENNPTLYDPEEFELNINMDASNVRETSSKLIMENLTKDNNFNIMIMSGSKGGPINMGQMGGCVGQQALEGQRIPKKMYGRTLPYYYQNDDSAEARGFIEQPYVYGMTPQSFIMHNISSREGLIDTAIRTSKSGYIQRRLVKATEDIMVAYDSTTRNSTGTLIEFVYGENGIDTIKQTEHKLNIVMLDNKELESQYKLTNQQLKSFPGFSEKTNNEYFETVLDMRNELRSYIRKSSTVQAYINNSVMLPVNLYRIINNVSNSDTDTESIKLDPKHVLKKLHDVLDYSSTQILALKNSDTSLRIKDDTYAKTLLKVALNEFLSPKRCIYELKLDKGQFDEICSQIVASINKSAVEAGEMVGVIAAQSIGEPVTQLTLNTFHHAGIGGMGTTTLGVPRITELINVSKNMKTPVMTIHLNKDVRTNKDIANKIAGHIKYASIESIRKRVDVYYDPKPTSAGGFMDTDKVSINSIFHKYKPTKNSCQSTINGMPWLMRIVLDKEKMMDKEITLLDIKAKFCSYWERRHTDIKGIKKEDKKILDKITQCSILSNSDNDKTAIVHIRFDMKEFDFSTVTGFIEVFVDKFRLKGIYDINKIINIDEQETVDYADSKNQEIYKLKENLIYTDGINMTSIRYINHIDVNNTICNDIVQTYKTFGIEAARATLYKEIKNTFNQSGSSLNNQHIYVLVDIMCNSGGLTSIDRHGLNKLETDPLARASFERPIDVLVTASVFSQVDTVNSVSSRIMTGQVIKGGTGLCEVVLDTDMLERSEYIEEDVEQKFYKTFNELESNAIMDDVVNKEGEDMFIPE